MKTTLFDEFLKTNKIKVKELPEPIQEKMDIYKQMHGQLDDTVAEDKKTLSKKLDDLDDEIYEDLLNEFEAELTNNEPIEEKKTSPVKKGDNVEIVGGNPIYVGAIVKVKDYYPKSSKRASESVLIEAPYGSAESTVLMDFSNVKGTKKKTPEEILDSIYEGGKIDNLSKSYLKSKGLEVDFSKWEIGIGKFILYRKSVFHLHFRLVKK